MAQPQPHAELNSAGQQAEAAARAGLGQHLRTYPALASSGSNVKGPATATAIFVAIAIAAFIGKQPVMGSIAGIAGVLCGIGAIVALMRDSSWQRTFRGARLDLYSDGVVAFIEARARVVRYDSTGVFQKVVHYERTGRTSYTYTLIDTAGEKFVLQNSFVEPSAWGATIQRAVTEAQYPRALSALEAGERLTFGPWWIDRHGIGRNDKAHPWADIERVNGAGGVASVSIKGKLIGLGQADVSSIMNYPLFESLCTQLITAHAAPGQP
ncbi:hypothetical protein K7711_07090 [Nocardia sp. CA2R105]|uniref:DUF6585 family protein n=1 Tax=Nocardia coffeae TaxID=2873381 RepID=UPI001CA7A33C|nr:DUF6585 family protein [Nocardia coffeae]MBY8856236.1 hypothetical protein [Nocardia coffeae]